VNRKKLFGTNGIRGLVNKELTSEMVISIGSAIGTFFKGGNLIIGHDARTSGPMFSQAIIAGLTSTGCNVFFAGLAPTPALQYAIKNHEMSGGIIISASHNPPEYNGIKVIWKDGIEISQDQEKQIEDIYFKKSQIHAKWNKLGLKNEIKGINIEYINAIKTHVNQAIIKSKKFHVVVDAGNSVGGLTAPYLLRDLGCKVTTINANIDGTFPGRLPEPKPETLTEMGATVKAIKADLGVAFDGDADRSIFVDEKGIIQWGDKTFALIIEHFLIKNPFQKIITPVSSSTLIKDTIEANKGNLILTKVGSVTVSQTMKKEAANLGGEENGGVFYGPHQAVRDGAMTTALILEIMAATNKSLSSLIDKQPKYFIEKGKIACKDENKIKIMKNFLQETKNENITTIDGVKIWFDNNSAILVRPSGTEPTIRLYAEAKNPETANILIQKYSLKLKKIQSSL
jgi:phosphomannomutase/phosphoglucomutase